MFFFLLASLILWSRTIRFWTYFHLDNNLYFHLLVHSFRFSSLLPFCCDSNWIDKSHRRHSNIETQNDRTTRTLYYCILYIVWDLVSCMYADFIDLLLLFVSLYPLICGLYIHAGETRFNTYNKRVYFGRCCCCCYCCASIYSIHRVCVFFLYMILPLNERRFSNAYKIEICSAMATYVCSYGVL